MTPRGDDDPSPYINAAYMDVSIFSFHITLCDADNLDLNLQIVQKFKHSCHDKQI